MEQKIVRSDGIEYERKVKPKNYTSMLYVRIESEKLELLKKMADENNESYSSFVRKIINKYLESEMEK